MCLVPQFSAAFFAYPYSAFQWLPKTPEKYLHPSYRMQGKNTFILYFGGDTDLYQKNSSYVYYFFLTFIFVLWLKKA